jgi:hypothetical protein
MTFTFRLEQADTPRCRRRTGDGSARGDGDHDGLDRARGARGT